MSTKDKDGFSAASVSWIASNGKRMLPQSPQRVTSRNEFNEPQTSEPIEPDLKILEWNPKKRAYDEHNGWTERMEEQEITVVDNRQGEKPIRLEMRTICFCRVQFERAGIPVYISTSALPDDPMNRYMRKRIFIPLAKVDTSKVETNVEGK